MARALLTGVTALASLSLTAVTLVSCGPSRILPVSEGRTAFAQTERDLFQKAQILKDLGLIKPAREKYQQILEQNPHQADAKKALEDLAQNEAEEHFLKASEAQKQGDPNQALRELDLTLKAAPHHPQAKVLYRFLNREQELKKSMERRVISDYSQGLEHYQKGQFDEALEAFVKVVNLDPSHKAAWGYIERIGSYSGKNFYSGKKND